MTQRQLRGCTVAGEKPHGDLVSIYSLNRYQGYKVAERLQKESRMEEIRKLVYSGRIIKKRRNLYCVGCNITGSTYGAADDPKFLLLVYFENPIFLVVNDLMKVGR